MKLKRSQNFNYLNLTSVPQTAPAQSEVNEIGATCHYLQLYCLLSHTKLRNLNLTAYFFYPRVIRYFCWKAGSKIANKNVPYTRPLTVFSSFSAAFAFLHLAWLFNVTSLRKINQKNLREDLTTSLHQYEALKFIKNCWILENKQLIRKIGLCNNVFLTYLFDIQQFKDIHVRSVLRLSIRTFFGMLHLHTHSCPANKEGDGFRVWLGNFFQQYTFNKSRVGTFTSSFCWLSTLYKYLGLSNALE